MVSISGPEGGPFPSQPATVTLHNPHSAAIQWFAVQEVKWVNFSRRKGWLQPGASGPLTATVDQAKAALLAPGIYDARVVYRHPTSMQRTTMVIFRLTVDPANYALSVTPGNAFNAQGNVGGPFNPSSQSYTLLNTGNVPFDWSATTTAPWVSAQSPSGGVLAPGASTILVAQLNSTLAAALPAGIHNAQLEFRRTSTGAVVEARAVSLEVLSPTSGWTDFTPSVDTRIVYVSTSGNDANNGLSPSTPKRTIAAGKALIRHGFPDWLLLKRGDVFDASIGHWKTSGRSAAEPQLISSYGPGTQRPFLRTGDQHGIFTMGGGNSPPQIDYVAIVGLEMWGNSYAGVNPCSGVYWLMETTSLLIEDCYIRGYQINIALLGIGGRKRDVAVRRNVLTDAFATSGSVGHAMYVDMTDNLLIEENVLDRNGWNTSVPGAVPSIFRHGIYIQGGVASSTGVVARGNIISNSSSHGLQMRSGGVVEDNLFVRNSIALLLGGSASDQNPSGVTAVARGNVILDGKNIDNSNPRGWGIGLENISSANVSYNIIAQRTLGTFPVPVTFSGSTGVGVRNTTVERNIVSNWGGSFMLGGSSTQLVNTVLRFNDFNQHASTEFLIDHSQASTANSVTSQGNRFRSLAASNSWMRVGANATSLQGWSTLVGDSGSTVLPSGAYPDPARTLATYHQSIGGTASHDAFMAQARLQSRTNWRPEYTAAAVNAYIRAGYGLVVP